MRGLVTGRFWEGNKCDLHFEKKYMIIAESTECKTSNGKSVAIIELCKCQ
jgi:hypothetical protein